MISRCCVIYVLLHLTDKVSLQDPTFEGVVGESVTLPCIFEKQTSTNVFWLVNDSTTVLNIKNGIASTEDQDEIFKDRAESFPSEYSKGNYSIKLRDLDQSHAGIYTCFEKVLNTRMQLLIKEKANNPTEKTETSTQGQNSSCVEREPLKMMTLLTALLGLTLNLT